MELASKLIVLTLELIVLTLDTKVEIQACSPTAVIKTVFLMD